MAWMDNNGDGIQDPGEPHVDSGSAMLYDDSGHRDFLDESTLGSVLMVCC